MGKGNRRRARGIAHHGAWKGKREERMGWLKMVRVGASRKKSYGKQNRELAQGD